MKPDAAFEGNPVELKPNTSSGISLGKRQLQKYMIAMDRQLGYLVTYSDGGATFEITVIIRKGG